MTWCFRFFCLKENKKKRKCIKEKTFRTIARKVCGSNYNMLLRLGRKIAKKNRETCGAALPPDELLRSPLLEPHLVLHLYIFKYLLF